MPDAEPKSDAPPPAASGDDDDGDGVGGSETAPAVPDKRVQYEAARAVARLCGPPDADAGDGGVAPPALTLDVARAGGASIMCELTRSKHAVLQVAPRDVVAAPRDVGGRSSRARQR